MRICTVDDDVELQRLERQHAEAIDRRRGSAAPRIREFHDATVPVEVRGVFSAERGLSSIGNWLTDRSGCVIAGPADSSAGRALGR